MPFLKSNPNKTLHPCCYCSHARYLSCARAKAFWYDQWESLKQKPSLCSLIDGFSITVLKFGFKTELKYGYCKTVDKWTYDEFSKTLLKYGFRNSTYVEFLKETELKLSLKPDLSSVLKKPHLSRVSIKGRPIAVCLLSLPHFKIFLAVLFLSFYAKCHVGFSACI